MIEWSVMTRTDMLNIVLMAPYLTCVHCHLIVDSAGICVTLMNFEMSLLPQPEGGTVYIFGVAQSYWIFIAHSSSVPISKVS